MNGRVAPVPVVLASTAGAGLLVVAALVDTGPGWAILLATVVAFLAGRAPSRPVAWASIGVLMGAVAANQPIRPDGDIVVPEIMLALTLFAAGLALRRREVMTACLAAQAADIEAERDVYAQLSVRYERARIAAVLHDVVAHAISVTVVQAGAGQRLAVTEPPAPARR